MFAVCSLLTLGWLWYKMGTTDTTLVRGERGNQMESRLNRLHGFIESHQWDDAWVEYQLLAHDGPPTSRLTLMGSHAAFGRHDYYRAQQLAESALTSYQPPEPVSLLGKIRFHLGMVARKIGDLHVALTQFETFLSEMPTQYPELSMGEAKAHFYLALTYRARNDFESSISHYRQAISLANRDGIDSLVVMSLQNLAWAYCMMDRPSDADECLERSRSLATSQEAYVHQMLGEAFVLVLQGKVEAADSRCHEVFSRASRNESITIEEKAMAAQIASRIATAIGKHDAALALVEASLVFAVRAQDARLINDANALKRSIVVTS
jgi:tetratricopeptide (TPR) repeat protein